MSFRTVGVLRVPFNISVRFVDLQHLAYGTSLSEKETNCCRVPGPFFSFSPCALRACGAFGQGRPFLGTRRLEFAPMVLLNHVSCSPTTLSKPKKKLLEHVACDDLWQISSGTNDTANSGEANSSSNGSLARRRIAAGDPRLNFRQSQSTTAGRQVVY